MFENDPITFKTSADMARLIIKSMDYTLLRMINARCLTRSNGNGKKHVTISYQGESDDRRTLINHIVSLYMEKGIRQPAELSVEYIDDMEKNKRLASLPIGD